MIFQDISYIGTQNLYSSFFITGYGENEQNKNMTDPKNITCPVF